MSMTIEHLPGHEVEIDATSDPDHVYLTCSCGGLCWVGGAPSGASMIEAADILREHLEKHGKEYREDAPQLARQLAGLFDNLFPPRD